MKSIFKDAFILFAITAVAGLLLALVFNVTKDPIAERQQQIKEESCQAVFPGAQAFTLATENYLSIPLISGFVNSYEKVTFDEIYDVVDVSGNSVGYVFTVTTKEGYGGDIQFMMGVTNEGKLNGVSILSSGETVGLGLEAENVLVPQFKDKTVESFVYTKTGSMLDNEIDAISSATITTNAFVNGVNAGLELYRTINNLQGVTVNE